MSDENRQRGGADGGEQDGRAVRAAMTEAQRVAGFQALVASDRGGGYLIEDADGEYRHWGEMSAAGRLRQIAGNAAYYDVPFEPFALAAQDALGAGGVTALGEAALRLVWRDGRELHALRSLIPDDGGTDPGPPLAEFFQGVMADGAAAADAEDRLDRLLDTLRVAVARAEPAQEPEQHQGRGRGR